ncbi:hypothetical protein [Cedecea davisae]|uniref:hypothetical protein n=1 Tax=Cedecea davisae TaxID=158484 RepID=UPI00242B22E4|nr:hypothetical protein [Cedecea davisae]
MKTVHLVQHTHWDREWYFTENDSKIVLYYFMLDLLTRLEQDETLPPILEKQARFSATDHLLLPNGNDQSPFEYGVPEALERLNTRQQDYCFKRSSFSDFFSALRASGESLSEWRGELLSPKYMRIHRGIFSTRADIKQLNASLEQFLSQTLEPLLA